MPSPVKVQLPGEVDIIALARFGAVLTSPTADHTDLLQAAADAAYDQYGDTGVGMTIVAPPYIKLRSDGITIRGLVGFQGQGSVIRSTADADTAALFTADPTVTSRFGLKGFDFNSDNRIVELKLNSGVSGSITADLEDLYVTSIGSPNEADYFYFSQVDFLRFVKIAGYNAARFLVVESPTVGQRSNTQIHAENVQISNSNLGVYLAQVDKGTLKGVDVAHCGSGIYLVDDNNSVSHERCHVEYFGDPDFAYAPANGHAFNVDNDTAQRGITYDTCTTLLPDTDAVSSYRLADQPTAGGGAYVHYKNCRAAQDAAKTGYRPLRIGGAAVWDGHFQFAVNEVELGTFNVARWTDFQVRPQRYAFPTSRNLLPFSRISRPEDLPSGTGGLTITASTLSPSTLDDARNVALTTGPRWASVSLQGGWHTLLVSAVAVGDDFYAFVIRNGGSFPTRVQARLRGDAAGQMFRLPFYVPTNDTGAHQIGLYAFGAGSSADIGRFEVRRGLVTDFSGDSRDSYASAVPTTGIYNVGDRVWNSVPAIGATPGWVCIAAPHTFEAMPNLGTGRRFKVGYYYSPDSNGIDAANAVVGDQVHAMPFTVGKTTMFDRIGIEVTTLQAGATPRLGIYADNGSGAPGALILDAGTVDGSTTGFKEITISQQLAPGLYWLVVAAQGTVTALQLRNRSGSNPFIGQSTSGTSNAGSFTQTTVSGALPSNFTGSPAVSSVGFKPLMRAA